ncbi:MAG: aminotransferase class I/II-fold pyridoxal phosphate-dependent enzyme [Chloroflexi bacterium]|nr:aminotransferase class I/II-fold pyridoxal phosphate-dependent enzyme [Chloroflexota bacterium]
MVIDLRSDTVSRPTDAMRQAMARAEVGDDVLGDDPTVQRLEEASAERVGKETGLYVPSGTMANLLALLVHCGRGDEAVVGSESHILHHEAVGASALGGISLRSVTNDDRGRIDADELRAVVRAPGAAPRTALVCLENTQNRCGGAAIPLDSMRGATEVARDTGAAVHLDGARIFNAALALETDAATIAALADTVSFCFSKGLGAPVGSVLTGPREVIDRARVLRRQLGGGMRQAGVIAAAALHALEHHVECLPGDHERAARLADGLASLPGAPVQLDAPDTNIVFFELDDALDGIEFRERLAAEGVLCSGTGPQRVRMVTHLDVDDAAIEAAVAAAARVIESMRAA